MTASLFSASWYRVAELRPRLRSHSEFHRHVYRGQVWHVLRNHASGRNHRFSPAAHLVVGLMNGQRTVQECWDTALRELGDDAPTQDETIHLLARLHASDDLECDVPPDTHELFERFEKQERASWKKRFANPLSLRFPLIDPDPLLEAALPALRWCFGPLGACLWVTVVGAALVLSALHWTELSHDVAGRVLTTQGLLLLWISYPIVKTLHEFGHAFATRMWGGEVHEMGIVLLVLMPVPYVDASSSSVFRERHRRIIVGAAGMAVELFVASLALFVWLAVEPGLVRSLAYNVMLIAGVSTLLFNGNPLLRYDGYYMLADAVSIPNLASRSTQYLGYLVKRYGFGMRELLTPAHAPGERAWFLFYGPASLIYRTFVLFVIVFFIAGRFFAVGMAIAVFAIATQLMLPTLKKLSFLFFDPSLGARRPRALALTCGLAIACGVLLFAIPVPLRTEAQGLVWLPEKAQVRAGSPGFVVRLLAPPEGTVVSGQPLIEIEDAFADAEVKLLEAQRAEQVARFEAEWRSDQTRAEVLREQLRSTEAELTRARERAAERIVRSPSDGVFVVPRAEDLPGRFIEQGSLLGYVVDGAPPTARVVVTQDDVALVRSHVEAVDVKLAERLGEVIPARLTREVPAATDQLPSAALGSAGGGSIAVHPADPEGLTSLETIFQFDVELDAAARHAHLGGRVFVRFDHGNEPLVRQGVRRLRQLFLGWLGA